MATNLSFELSDDSLDLPDLLLFVWIFHLYQFLVEPVEQGFLLPELLLQGSGTIRQLQGPAGDIRVHRGDITGHRNINI